MRRRRRRTGEGCFPSAWQSVVWDAGLAVPRDVQHVVRGYHAWIGPCSEAADYEGAAAVGEKEGRVARRVNYVHRLVYLRLPPDRVFWSFPGNRERPREEFPCQRPSATSCFPRPLIAVR